MSEQRILRLNELLKEEIGSILLRELDVPQGILVTVTRVEIDEERESARVFISVYPSAKRKEVMKELYRRIADIQHALNKRLREYLVPKIVFRADYSVEEAGEVEKRLAEISQNGEGDTPEEKGDV